MGSPTLGPFVVTDCSAEGAIIDCDLSGLRLGERLDVESASGVRRHAIVRWVGVVPSSERTMQLRIALDFSLPVAAATGAETALVVGPRSLAAVCEESPADDAPQAMPRSRTGRVMACVVGAVLGIMAVQVLRRPPHLAVPLLQSLVQRVAGSP
jgi:hypothetical protein